MICRIWAIIHFLHNVIFGQGSWALWNSTNIPIHANIYILFKFMMQFYEKIINGGKESLALLMENEMECALFWTWFCKHDINANVWKFKWNCNLLYYRHWHVWLVIGFCPIQSMDGQFLMPHFIHRYSHLNDGCTLEVQRNTNTIPKYRVIISLFIFITI